MSETKHPERRVGQTWRYLKGGGSAFTLGERADVRRSGGKSDEVWEDTSGREWFGWGQDGFFALIADVPAVAPLAVDRTGCKAPEWCGIHRNKSEPGRDIHFFRHVGSYESTETHIYCSPACRDARLPPLAAQPAETKRILAKSIETCCQADRCCAAFASTCPRCQAKHCLVHAAFDGHACKPAPQPAPAKPHDFSDPYCARAQERLCKGCGVLSSSAISVLHCTPNPGWRERFEIAIADNVAPYTGPERIERPRLAHSMGVEDPALEDA